MRVGIEQNREEDARRAVLAGLRAALERAGGGAREMDGWTLGDPALSGIVPGLSVAALHEAVPADGREAGAAAGFAVALALRRLLAKETRPVLWVARRDGLHEAGALSGRGLAGLGSDPGRFLLAAGRTDTDVLWALEEAVRSGAVALAVGEVEAADLVATRRLSLAAREHGVPVLLLRSERACGPSAARTRWRVASAPSRPQPFAQHAPGVPRWRVALEKGWAERPQEWIVEWDDEAHHIRLAAPLADRAAGAVAERGGTIVSLARAG